MRTLVESLEFNSEALQLISQLLEKDEKLKEDFQKQKLYEFLIDFLYKKNSNIEEKILDNETVLKILQILEDGSMNEFVRDQLSDKKKIKDLFFVVIRSINIEENKMTVSSLITFASNLCYGSNKFRNMLKNENLSQFFSTLKEILISTDKVDSDINKSTERILLKQTVLGFIGNLANDTQIRQQLGSNFEGLLEQVCKQFKTDSADRRANWEEICKRQLGFLINCGFEENA